MGSTWLRVVLGLLLVVAGFFGVLAFLVPAPISPVAWRAPAAPALTGALTRNNELDGAERLPLGDGVGGEDVAVWHDGRMITGLDDGRLLVMAPDGRRLHTLLGRGGRPLGLDWAADGSLIVADAGRGLLRVRQPFSPDAAMVDTLIPAGAADAAHLHFADDVAVGPDGRIYVSDASARFTIGQSRLDIIEGRGTGRLLAYDPAERAVRVLLSGLHFANGVAVADDGSSVLVVETGRYRLRQLFLSGPRAGESRIVADNLPGFPDGVSRGAGGVYWVALFAPRNALLDRMHPYPVLKRITTLLPDWLAPAPVRSGHVLGLTVAADGAAVMASLDDPDGSHLHHVTSVEERGGMLFLGTLDSPHIARIPRPALAVDAAR
ncbi:SMP-30/gluconolactonase/LRE family protein [Yunchengibacter salinarum]|uniref:SMP-30/gluconolactonase/LRE family protein n=1 Tax=Yunchengibacter salinarum TaxID=3133399 RepID=UPI0035B5FBA5